MDARHQRDGRSDWSKRFQNTAENIFGIWKYYKMNLETNSTETIKEGRAMLEISTARVINSVRSSEARRKHFGHSYLTTDSDRDVEYFNSTDEMKLGAKIYTQKYVYWAEHQLPAKKAVEEKFFQAAA